MPTNRFSTMSTRPTPCREPISLRRSIRGSRGKPLTVHADGITLFVRDDDVFRCIGSVLGVRRPAEHVLGRLVPGVLEDAAFITDVEQVGVHRVRLLCGNLDWDFAVLAVFDAVGPRTQRPGPPRRDDLDARVDGQGSQAQSEPDRCPCRSRRAKSRRRLLARTTSIIALAITGRAMEVPSR